MSYADPFALSWEVSVGCKTCDFANEKQFENLLAAFMRVPAFMRGATVIQQQQTAMRVSSGSKSRYPDIYWYNQRANWGWINELKVGNQRWYGRNIGQANYDWSLLYQGYAYAAFTNSHW